MNIVSLTTRFSHVLLITLFLTSGCAVHEGRVHSHYEMGIPIDTLNQDSDTRVSLGLDQAAQKVHQAVMQDHLKAIHEIMAALARGEYERAQRLTEKRLGFAIHREAMKLQKPEGFPPAYHDLAMTHHQAAENLAKVLPSKNLNRILPYLERTLHACVQCHETYKR